MKQLITLLFLAFISVGHAQETKCELDFEIDNDSVQLKRFKEHLLYEMDMGKKRESLFFSLIESEGIPLLEVQYLLRSPDFIPTQCFNDKSLISIQLLNGQVISLRHVAEESCSTFVYDAPEKTNIRILSSYFRILDNDVVKLQQAPISLIQIRFSIEQKTFVVKNELNSSIVNQSYRPASFFQENLACLKE